MPTDWISTEEAAELSGYHPEHIRRLIRQGKIKASRKGAMFWVDRPSLLTFLKASERAKSKDKRHGPKSHGDGSKFGD
jgi:excisionase family DNA binding protein